MRLVSQLIKGISKVLQILLRCFKSKAVSTSFAPASLVFLVNIDLNLNGSVTLSPSKSSILLSFNAGSFLEYYHKLSVF